MLPLKSCLATYEANLPCKCPRASITTTLLKVMKLEVKWMTKNNKIFGNILICCMWNWEYIDWALILNFHI